MPELQIILIRSLKQAPWGPLLDFFKNLELETAYIWK
jgi:hypothetical protein